VMLTFFRLRKSLILAADIIDSPFFLLPEPKSQGNPADVGSRQGLLGILSHIYEIARILKNFTRDC